MKIFKSLFYTSIIMIGIIFINGCGNKGYENTQEVNQKPSIDPDYAGVTIPANIAPMNFIIQEEGDIFKIKVTSSSTNYKLSVSSSDGIVRFPESSWKRLIKACQGGKIKIQVSSAKNNEKVLKKYKPFYMNVSNEPIDPYLSYRLIYPGYESWHKMKIKQRSLESFKESSIAENQLIGDNCLNCHAFNNNKPNTFLLHIRGSKGGTYFADDQDVKRRALKTENIPSGATYPAWHPSGRFVAFSSNKVRQVFYAHPQDNIEVLDVVSSLILYDREKNEIQYIKEQDTTSYMQTFPSWSPNGQYLYFCVTKQFKRRINVDNIKDIHYNLARKAFNPAKKSFGETEIVFDASKQDKSVSFPKISPNGQYIVFTIQDYGTFPIQHKEADLYLFNLKNGKYKKMNLNSSETESYHNWSSNGKWLVFSSKRRDGSSARPYFAYFGSPDNIGKPFVLPQKNPDRYHKMLKSFNIPEFVTGKVNIGPRDFERAANKKSLRANPVNPEYIPSKWKDNNDEQSSVRTNWKFSDE